MAEYISQFITGFEEKVSRWIPRELGGAEIQYINGGLAYYKYTGKPEFVAKLPFVNNSFTVISKYNGTNLTFEKMAYDAAGKTLRQSGGIKTGGRGVGGGSGGSGGRGKNKYDSFGEAETSFRVRFSREGQFEKVPFGVLEAAERAIAVNYGLYVDRDRPDHEFWFILRRGEPGFFGRLLKKPAAARLNKGELRPELAGMMCLDCAFDKNTVVCDPFAGYGSIPLYIQKHYPYKKMYVNDYDRELAIYLKKTRLGRDAKVMITQSDALPPVAANKSGSMPAAAANKSGVAAIPNQANAAALGHIGGGTVDLVITDPPWGFVGQYGDIKDFYRRALTEIKRILKDSGRAVILTGIPSEMAGAARSASLEIASRENILVNGKKAAVYTLVNARTE